MNVFGAVNQSVTTRQAADLYGVNVRRGGMACCIFHDDKTPSMKVDNRYHCFGCQADGDVIDFTAQLFGMGNKQAAEKLAADFEIGYDNQSRAIQKPVIRQLTPEQKLRQETDRYYRVLCDYLHLLERWKADHAPQKEDEDWHPLFVEALQKTEYVNYLLDILLDGTPEEKMQLVKMYGKDVKEIAERIERYEKERKPKQRKRTADLAR